MGVLAEVGLRISGSTPVNDSASIDCVRGVIAAVRGRVLSLSRVRMQSNSNRSRSSSCNILGNGQFAGVLTEMVVVEENSIARRLASVIRPLPR